MSILDRTTENKYGLQLGEFFDPIYLDLSRHLPPSEGDLRQAIQTLSRPEDVSFETFERILAMEWTPTCAHLRLLVSSPMSESESNTGVFPSCIKLLQRYCQGEGRGLFDDSYGFLCLQVVSLSLEVAKLVEMRQLDFVLSELSALPPNQPISETLNRRTRERERSAILTPSLAVHPPFIRSTLRVTGDATYIISCLHQIGGCDLSDIHFLVGQMWSARRDVLRTARWATDIFLGWRGLLYVAWNLMFEKSANYLRRSMWPGYNNESDSPEEREYWTRFLEVAYRCSLCSSEVDNEVLNLLLTRCSKSMIPRYHPKGIAVDDQDSNEIATAYRSKIRSAARLNSGFVPLLFGYACNNLKQGNFEDNLQDIVIGTFERGWVELSRAHELSTSQWGAFTDSIVEILSVLIKMCKPNATGIRTILTIASNKNLFEYLGCLLLFPLSPLGAGVIESATKWDSKIHQDVLVRYGQILAVHMVKARFEPSEDLIITWYKILRCFNFHKLMSPTRKRKDYAQTWEGIWLRIGESLKLHQRTLQQIPCAYSRCPAPNSVLFWGCKGCTVRHYCNRRCQHADWMCPTKPHRSQCTGEAGAQKEVKKEAGRSERH